VGHVHTPPAAGNVDTSVLRKQQPLYQSSIARFPLATCDPNATKVMLKRLVVSHENREPGTGEVTCSAPPSTVMTFEDRNTEEVSTVDVRRRK
jgi:hypothetical protein